MPAFPGALGVLYLSVPGFHGVRTQVQALLNTGRETWARTHRKSDVYPWPERVPYLDKGFACYHAPEPLRLDVLVRLLRVEAAGLT